MSRTTFHDFETGTLSKGYVFALLVDVVEKESKNGSKYVSLILTDGQKQVDAKMWDMTKEGVTAKPGTVVQVLIENRPYNNQPSYIASLLRVASASEGYKVEDFIPCAPVSAEEMYDFLFNTFDKMKNKDLSSIGKGIFGDYKEKLLIWPAAQKNHHAIRAGLLYHVYRMLLSAEIVIAAYGDSVDAEMVKAGIILHDIGKLEEMTATPYGPGEYTADGVLFGHFYLGMRMVERYGLKSNANPKAVRHLMHIIASHHGKIEYGTMQIPKTTEAFIVSQLDMLDAQLYKYEQGEASLQEGEFNKDYYKF